jgi:membrane fusion protein (multidrug efflux system)
MPSPSSTKPSTLLLFVSVALLVGGCGDKPQPQPGSDAVPVTVVTLTSGTITLTRELPGRTAPYLVAEVRPQVDGIITRRLFTEGGTVKAGQPLYQLDDATYRASLASASASLARAEATLLSARLTAARSKELLAMNAVSKQDDENAAAALQQAEADVAAARAAEQSARVILGYARITAPISGRIGRSSVTQGALVTANQQAPLAVIQQLDPIYVDLTQSSTEWLALQKAVEAGRLQRDSNLPVTVVLEDGTEYSHDGRLEFREVSVDPTTGSFALRVVVPNPDHLLLPGMYVRAVVRTGVRQDAVLAPQQGILRDPRGNTNAMVVGKDGTVEARPVRVSQAIGDQWLVEDGLSAGDQVIIEGLQKIRPGVPVQATEAGATPRQAAATSDTPATAD